MLALYLALFFSQLNSSLSKTTQDSTQRSQSRKMVPQKIHPPAPKLKLMCTNYIHPKHANQHFYYLPKKQSHEDHLSTKGPLIMNS